MSHPSPLETSAKPSGHTHWRCIDCGAGIDGGFCVVCERPYPVRGGIVEAIHPLTGRNAIAARFYDGEGWRRFRPWERLFLRLQGGTRRARLQILRHVLTLEQPAARVLEVGIGDGANLRWLPSGWTVYGVDVSRVQLRSALDAHPTLSGRLAWAEAEALPFADGHFDACWTLGGFTYFRDHEAALREMCRVTRPGGPVVIADEISGLHRAGIGHLIGCKKIDAFWLRVLGLDRDFVAMVFGHRFDPDALRRRAWPGARRYRIWAGLGYCLVGEPGTTPQSAP